MSAVLAFGEISRLFQLISHGVLIVLGMALSCQREELPKVS